MKKIMLALTLAGVAIAPGAALGQSSSTKLHDVYYSDATHTDIVGEVIVYCDDTVHQWGYPSGYPLNIANNDC